MCHFIVTLHNGLPAPEVRANYLQTICSNCKKPFVVGEFGQYWNAKRQAICKACDAMKPVSTLSAEVEAAMERSIAEVRLKLVTIGDELVRLTNPLIEQDWNDIQSARLRWKKLRGAALDRRVT